MPIPTFSKRPYNQPRRWHVLAQFLLVTTACDCRSIETHGRLTIQHEDSRLRSFIESAAFTHMAAFRCAENFQEVARHNRQRAPILQTCGGILLQLGQSHNFATYKPEPGGQFTNLGVCVCSASVFYPARSCAHRGFQGVLSLGARNQTAAEFGITLNPDLCVVGRS